LKRFPTVAAGQFWVSGLLFLVGAKTTIHAILAALLVRFGAILIVLRCAIKAGEDSAEKFSARLAHLKYAARTHKTLPRSPRAQLNAAIPGEYHASWPAPFLVPIGLHGLLYPRMFHR
jgi:hypothetical protein